MNHLHLTDKEIQEITGKKRWSSQVKVLRQLALETRIRPDGKPLVVRQHYLQMMGVGYSYKREEEPNWVT